MIMYNFLKFIFLPFFKFYYNPKIIGKENILKNVPLLIACNHKHLFDQFLVIISTKRYIRYMAKSEYFEKNIFSWVFRLVGFIPVHRNRKDNEAVSLALSALKNNECVGIFPEGTRNRSNNILLPFKFGTVSMANKSNSYVLPCSITGDYKFRSKNLIIKFGVPFKVFNMSLEDANKKLKNEIEKLIIDNLSYTNRTFEEEIASHIN